MKTAILGGAAAVLMLITAACQRPGEAALAPQASVPFEDRALRLMLPDWPASVDLGEFELIRVSQAGHLVTISRYQGVPRLVGPSVAQALPEYGPFAAVDIVSLEPERVEIETYTLEERPQRLAIVFLYCDGFTYSIGGASVAESWSSFEPVMDQVLAGLTCASTPVRAERHPKMIGMVINPPGGDFDFAGYRQAAVQARSAGLEAAHLYLTWDSVESDPGQFDWAFSDMLLDTLWLEGLRLSLVIEYIHTSVPGGVPPDLEGMTFRDPGYSERATEFALAVADRYGDQLDYLALGNEVNIYFGDHSEDLDPYLALFQQMRLAVNGQHPELPIGTTLAFHEAQNSNRMDLVEAFKGGDFLAYTYYPHDPLFSYDVPVDRFAGALQAMVEVSGDTPFFIVENGFSSSTELGSSEARQADYVEASVQAYLAQAGADGRLIWIGQHDVGVSCQPAAESFFPPEFDPSTIDPAAWQAFQEYLCTLGLRRADGTPKPGWSVLLDQLPSTD